MKKTLWLAVLGFVLIASGPSGERTVSPHGNGLAMACTSCHTADAWTPLAPVLDFDHAGTGFVLEGGHAGEDCGDCHRHLVFSFVGTACADCHEDAHGGELGFTCDLCHDPAGWQDRRSFADAHARTLFPLLAPHAGLDCQSCHTRRGVWEYAGTPVECDACHLEDYRATVSPDHEKSGFSTFCLECHQPAAPTWRSAAFGHPASFALSGAHGRIGCEECHTSGFVALPTDCDSCHLADYRATTDPKHDAAGFPLACETCHNERQWEGAQFNHNQTRFPLRDSHAGLDCQECHASGYAGTPLDCFSCHADDYDRANDPDHRAAGFPTRCETCHDATRWEEANWDHDSLFPIYSGEHRRAWSDCSDCHVNAASFRTFEFIFCHEHSRSEMNDEHDEVRNYRYESRACLDCHPDGRE